MLLYHPPLSENYHEVFFCYNRLTGKVSKVLAAFFVTCFLYVELIYCLSLCFALVFESLQLNQSSVVLEAQAEYN